MYCAIIANSSNHLYIILVHQHVIQHAIEFYIFCKNTVLSLNHKRYQYDIWSICKNLSIFINLFNEFCCLCNETNNYKNKITTQVSIL